MKRLIASTIILTAFAIHAQEILKLRSATVVSVIVDGKVTGKRTLKPGTEITVIEEVPAAAAAPAAGKLTPSKISPIMFKTTRPKAGATFEATIKLDNYYNYDFENQQGKYWSISIDAGDETFAGYLSKSSKLAKTIIPHIQNGEKCQCLITLRPVKNKDDKDGVTIEDFCLPTVPQM